MKTRTLSMFFEENGVNLLDLSESIDVTPEELENVKDFYFVPEELADKIVKAYSLPEGYFSEDIEAPEKRNVRYFTKLSIGWDLLTSLAVGAVVLIGMLVSGLISGEDNFDGFFKAFSVFIGLTGFVLVVASCVLLEKYYKKRNSDIGNFGRYKFLYFIIPTNIMLVTNLIGMLSVNSEFFFVYILEAFIIPLNLFLLGAFLCGLLMESSQSNNVKTKNILAAVGCVTLIIYSVISSVLEPNDSAFISTVKNALVEIPLCIIMTLGITVGDKFKPSLHKIWYTVLPLIYLAAHFLTLPLKMF